MVITGIVHTIRKHIVSEQALAGGNEYVGVEEPAPFGIVISALQVIQPGLWDMLVVTTLFLLLVPSGGFPSPGRPFYINTSYRIIRN